MYDLQKKYKVICPLDGSVKQKNDLGDLQVSRSCGVSHVGRVLGMACKSWWQTTGVSRISCEVNIHQGRQWLSWCWLRERQRDVENLLQTPVNRRQGPGCGVRERTVAGSRDNSPETWRATEPWERALYPQRREGNGVRPGHLERL